MSKDSGSKKAKKKLGQLLKAIKKGIPLDNVKLSKVMMGIKDAEKVRKKKHPRKRR